MSDKIRERIQSEFDSLLADLLKTPALHYILQTGSYKLEDDGEGTYRYEIPIIDGALILTYEDKGEGANWENLYSFTFRRNAPPHSGIYCFDAQKDLKEWLKGEGIDCEWDYEEEDDTSALTVTTSLEKSWRKSAAKQQEMHDHVLNAWLVMDRWKSLTEKESKKKPDFFSLLKETLTGAIQEMAKSEPAIQVNKISIDMETIEYSNEGGIEDFDVDFRAPCQDENTEVLVWCRLVESIKKLYIGIRVFAPRHGLTQKRAKELAGAFFPDDMDLGMEGSGKEGVFYCTVNLDYTRGNLAGKKGEIAEAGIRLYQKAMEFSELLGKSGKKSSKKPAAKSRGKDSAHVPAESSPKINPVVLFHAIRDLLHKDGSPLKNVDIKASRIDGAGMADPVSFSSEITGPVLHMELKYDPQGGKVSLSAMGEIYKLKQARIQRIWDESGLFKEDGEFYIMTLDELDGQSVFKLNNSIRSGMTAENCLDMLAKAYKAASKFSQLLKKFAEGHASTMQAEAAPSDKATASGQRQAKSETPPAPARTRKQAPAPAQPDEDGGADSQDPQKLENFKDMSKSVLNLFKGNEKISPHLPQGLPDPVVEEDSYSVIMPLLDSPAQLRFRMHPDEDTVDLGWQLDFANPALTDMYRREAHRLKKKISDVHTRVHEDQNIFALFHDVELKEGQLDADALASLYKKAATLYRETVRIKNVVDRDAS